MKSQAISIAIALLAGAIIAATTTAHPLAIILLGDSQGIGLAIGCVLLAASILMLITTFDQGRTQSVLRLDWFSPVLRRLKSRQHVSYSLPGRFLRRLLPQSWQSDRDNKQRGLIRRFLRRFGRSWLASPARRIVQGLCLLTFLWLFFYVCWPYSAAPAPPGRASVAWQFQELDQNTEDVMLAGGQLSQWSITAGDHCFLKDGGAFEPAKAVVGEFEVVGISDNALRLRPIGELAIDTIDALFTSSGPWSVHETDPLAWPDHYAKNLAAKEIIPAETFLLIDPLVSLSTAVASRSWVWSLASAGIILIVCVLIPRGFCGYLCPLGTTIDLFDWAVSGRTKRFHVPGDGWWVHLKYYLLAGTMICAMGGVLVSGFFSAIPVMTRGLLFIVDPLQSGTLRGWHLIPTMNAGHAVSIILFLAVLGLGFLRPRFWCKYVCPSGAVFSLGNLFRATERKVESSCINCNKCVEICPFDAIKPDFTTRTTDCTMCQSCAGVCPTESIKFVERWNFVELKTPDNPPTNETAIGRRGFMSLATGSAAAVAGGLGLTTLTKTFGANLDAPDAFRPVRPPGSVPEQQFLEMCIRCGECFKACPNNVLQPEGFEQGLEGLWTPMVVANWAGCESSCNACGQVCPTGAIRALPLAEKKVARMGLAIVNETTCLPLAGKEACDLCVQECNAAGYNAIEFTQVHAEVDDNGAPVPGSGYLAPVVLKDQCVGCGLCQTRCNVINVKEKGLLSESAIIIEAGEGYEDRLMTGSYVELRKQESDQSNNERIPGPATEFFIPE